MRMQVSEITFLEILDNLRFLAPIKIIYNDTVIYNDYDSKVEIEPGVYGELLPPICAIRHRNPEYFDKKVDEYNVTIVDFHHCVLNVKGE